MGVLGLTSDGTEMPGEGIDMFHGICAHLITLTKPGGMSKHIGAGDLRVYSSRCCSSSPLLPSRRRALAPALTVAFGQPGQFQAPKK